MSTEGHADLVGKECREVRFLRGIVPREGADVSPVLLRTLLGQEPKRTVARCLKFTVRHGTKSGQKSSGWWRREQRARVRKNAIKRGEIATRARSAVDDLSLSCGHPRFDQRVLTTACE